MYGHRNTQTPWSFPTTATPRGGTALALAIAALSLTAGTAGAQAGTAVAPADWADTRSTVDEVFAIKGWAGGETDGGNKSFVTSFTWSVVALPSGVFRYEYDFLKSRGPRLGTLGIELPAFCETNLATCVDPSSLTATIDQLPSATFSVTPSWYNFGDANADLIPLTKNAFSGLRLDFDEFESEGGGSDGTGLATMNWSIAFNSTLAPMWGSFFGSPLLSDEEGDGGEEGGNPEHGNPGHGGGGDDGGEEVEGPRPGCAIDYGIAPDPITGETEIPGPPRAYNCGSYYAGNVPNGGWVATPGVKVPEPSSAILLAAGMLGLGVVSRRRR